MQIAAIRFGATWSLVHGRGRAGRFGDQLHALLAGERLAFDAIAKGHEVQLLVQLSSGRLVKAPLGIASAVSPTLGKAAA